MSVYPDPRNDAYWLRGDLTGAGVNAAAGNAFAVAAYVNLWVTPYSYDWQYGITGPIWGLDTNLDTVEDYTVVMTNLNGTVIAGVLNAADQVVCYADTAWDISTSMYGAVFDPNCIGNPAQVNWTASFLYEDVLTGRDSYDQVPDSGWVGPVTNESYVAPTTTTAPATTSPVVTAPANQGGTASGCVASPIAIPGGASDGYTPLVPARLMDTRPGLGTVDCQYSGIGLRSGGSVTELQVAGRGGVPSDASAVVLNVTATEGAGAGFVTVFPCGSGQPLASNLNFVGGEAVPNAVVAKIGTGGRVCLYSNVGVHLVVDVEGFFSASAGLKPLYPARLLDTRLGGTRLRGGSVLPLAVAGAGGSTFDATAVVLNVTATGASAAGFITVFPCGTQPPLASNLNFAAGDTIPNAVVAKIGVNGAVCFYSNVDVDLVVDINGYFGSTAQFASLSPARLLETRSGLATVDGQFNGIGARIGGTVTELTVTGRGGVPATATAVVLNVTATEATAAGFVTVFPCGSAQPLASNLNFAAGDTIPNAVVAKVGAGGKVCLYSNVNVHLIVDVNGYYR